MAQIDRDWALLSASFGPRLDLAPSEEPLDRALRQAQNVGLDAPYRQLHSQANSGAGIWKPELTAQAQSSLEAIQSQLASGPTPAVLAAKAPLITLLRSLELQIHAPDLEPASAAALGGFARRMQQEGCLSVAAVGMVLIERLLDRAEADPSIAVALSNLPVPSADEVHNCLLRTVVAEVEAYEARLGLPPGPTPTAALPPEAQVARRAVLTSAARLAPFRGHPEDLAQAEIPRPPGPLLRAVAEVFPVPGLRERVLAAEHYHNPAPFGRKFAEQSARWQRIVIGSASPASAQAR